MNPIFLSVPRGNKEAITASLYTCRETHQDVVGNKLAVPLSPFTGMAMTRATPKTITASNEEISSELSKIGKCTSCKHELVANSEGIKLANKHKKLHCVMCGGDIQLVKAATNPILPDTFDDYDLGEDENLHDDPRVLHGDKEFEDVGLNHLLLSDAQDDQDDDQDDDQGDDEDDNGDDEDYNDDDLGDVSDESDDDGDDDDQDYDEPADDDDDEDNGDDEDYDPDAEDDSDAEDTTDEGDDDQDEGDEGDQDEGDQDDGDSDDDRNVQASAVRRGMNRNSDVKAQTTADTMGDSDDQGNDENIDSSAETTDNIVSAKYIDINASDALFESLASEQANLGVVVLSSDCAMIFANVDGIGYMPVVALDRDKASDDVKPLFDKSEKFISTVNSVLASADAFDTKLLKNFGPRELVYNVKAASYIENRIKSGVAALTDSMKEERGQIIDDLRQCLAIASVKVLKNLSEDARNEVSAHLAESLKKAGVRSANNLIDEAFTTKGPDLMTTIISEALDLLDKPMATRNEIAKYVSAAAGRSVGSSKSPSGDAAARYLAEGSVPLAVSASAQGDGTGEHRPTTVENNASKVVDFNGLVKSAAARRRNVS